MGIKGENKLKQSAPAFAMALFVLMLGCILLLVAFGSTIYANIVKTRDINNAKRASLSYISQRVRSQQEAGGIKIAEGPEGEALVITQDSELTGCETRIYLYNGNLVEEYAFIDSEYNPENAQIISATKRFDIKLNNNELLIATSEGASYISLNVEVAA